MAKNIANPCSQSEQSHEKVPTTIEKHVDQSE